MPGATWVILGHSERRQNHGETDELVREKVLAAVEAGLIPIVCVGETEEQRASGQETEVVGWQLAGSLPKPFTGVVAYEPVWAIGTGKTATDQDVATMHAFIREELVRQFGEAGHGIRILYGGSMRPANAAALLAVPHVGGGLIGGASLKAERLPGDCPGRTRSVVGRCPSKSSPSPCGRGLWGGAYRTAQTPPPNPLPQGEGE